MWFKLNLQASTLLFSILINQREPQDIHRVYRVHKVGVLLLPGTLRSLCAIIVAIFNSMSRNLFVGGHKIESQPVFIPPLDETEIIICYILAEPQ